MTTREKKYTVLRAVLCLATGLSGASAAAPSPSELPTTPRDFYNAGTRELRQGKLREAEASLQTALASQDDRLQPSTLYNLGHVRFGLGLEELKKGPSSSTTSHRGQTASLSAADAAKEADEALASDDVQKMVAAYLSGRGARKELKAATQAVRNALRTYGVALDKWQRSSGDFKSTVELDPKDHAARQNAETVDRYIAKLVDSVREMEQLMAAMGLK